MKVEVEADRLATLLVMDASLEPRPAPIRLQPEVTVVINFEEYLRFVQLLPAGSAFLNSSIEKMQQCIRAHEERSLLKAFYVDMALAVGKELYFAETFHKGATVIRHEFYSCRTIKKIASDPDGAFLLGYLLKTKGFPLPAIVSEVNRLHWDYACMLIQEASKLPSRWNVPL